jgi:triosephosphate isomerase (TIM)
MIARLMRRPIVAGNWKMQGSTAANEQLLTALKSLYPPQIQAACVVCPPFVYLTEVARQLRGTPIELGAQNVAAEAPGAFTGEIAAGMLREVGCQFGIVGHSERRALYSESDARVAQKFVAAQAAGLTPILCVGEQLAQREAEQTETVIAQQLDAVVQVTGIAAFEHAVVAYEPVWAIGTGRTASPAQAQAVHAFIRARLAKADARIAAELRILYGGSVKGANAAELFAMPDVDGGLIGGASLNAQEFITILKAA